MPTIDVHLPRLHAAQPRMLDEARRYNVAVCGRRVGKSTMGEDILANAALDGFPVAYYEPTFPYLMEAWRSLTRILRPVITKVQQTPERRIELVTGGSITMWSLQDPNSSRGRKYKAVVIDEAAQVRKLQEAWEGTIQPTLLDMKGSAWFLSTPRGLNYLHTLYRRGETGADPEWRAWRMPTTANPYIDAAEVAKIQGSAAELWFRQEYMAEFVDMEGSVFRRIQDAATATPLDGPEAGHTYVFGVDWGKLNDWTVITVLDVTAKCVVAIERFNQIDYTLQLGRLRAMYAHWGPQTVIAEANSMGEPLIDTLRQDGLPVSPFHTSNASKAVIIDALAMAFDEGAIGIPNDTALVGELLAYEAQRLPSGLLRYGAPDGMHDDCVMSLALAWSGIGQGEDIAAAYHVVRCTCGRDYFNEPVGRACPSCGRRQEAA